MMGGGAWQCHRAAFKQDDLKITQWCKSISVALETDCKFSE